MVFDNIWKVCMTLWWFSCGITRKSGITQFWCLVNQRDRVWCRGCLQSSSRCQVPGPVAVRSRIFAVDDVREQIWGLVKLENGQLFPSAYHLELNLIDAHVSVLLRPRVLVVPVVGVVSVDLVLAVGGVWTINGSEEVSYLPEPGSGQLHN